jgi:hypothetical protein
VLHAPENTSRPMAELATAASNGNATR